MEIWSLIVLANISFGSLRLVSLITMRYRRIDSGNRHVEKLYNELKFKIYVIKQYYKIHRGEIFTLFSRYDERESFSTVSPIFISKFDKKANVHRRLLDLLSL